MSDGSPIDLINYDKASQRFELNPKAVETILEVGGNTGLIFNIGEPKIGKSYLLNRVMDLKRGFQENSRGMKLWSKPFYREDENLFLFFIDAQGFDSDSNFANFVWSLSFLTGTIVLYNSKGNITEKTFDALKPLEHVAAALKISPDSVENSYMMSYYAPKLIWVLKDHRAIEDVNGKPMQPDKYLETSLLEQSSNAHSVAVKKFITNIVRERCCVAFGNFQGDNDLMAYNTSVLKEKIYSRSFIKYFDGVPFSARMIVNFMVGFIELFNAKKDIEYYDM